jgi:hypothetical protein
VCAAGTSCDDQPDCLIHQDVACSYTHSVSGSTVSREDTFEECRATCSSKHPDEPRLVAAYNPMDSASNKGLCQCRSEGCALNKLSMAGPNSTPGAYLMGYAHCTKCGNATA